MDGIHPKMYFPSAKRENAFVDILHLPADRLAKLDKESRRNFYTLSPSEKNNRLKQKSQIIHFLINFLFELP